MKELTKVELKNVSGGYLGPIAAFFAGVVLSGLVGEVILDGPSKCIAEFKDGWNNY
ncbi:hypothetical protein [Prolixibacter sp. SD074]|jgi:bacteriocin-like protein|uniref:hypothetical protein n=1 Tax=Prolixibacter sp. SD074 TaxID=2652391 RepID=UPI00127B21CE|nr:hypothetical protein [Prolixibacter sp. SD074]GET29919.1 hypothetical protein SD074_21210 [Prolixibacter sp. SD074]GET29940.1 hypothetical protein SD074_21420 [Prolixibacter sp. SD074]